MFIRPLIQFRQTVETALNGMTNISKPFVTFFIETMEMYLSISKKINFTQMARFGRSCESRFRQNFRKAFDWITFNRSFLPFCHDHLVTLAIDPCFISKAGKKTPGISYFWSGCASAMKRGLEILGIAAVDAHTRQAVFLKAEQTFTDKLRGRKPGCTKGMKDPDSLVGWYLRMLMRNSKQLLEVSRYITADAYFSKKSFADGLHSLGFHLISRFRDDVRLRYIYRGPKVRKRGRPKEYDGTVDVSLPDMKVVRRTDISVDGECYTLIWADVKAVGLEREVRVVIVDCPELDKKTQKRKVFFSTDLNLTAENIFLAYRSRFQIEFCCRDAKQMTGLTHCQARNKEALAFAFNMSLASVNVAKAVATMNGLKMSVGSVKILMHNASMLERIFSMSGIRPNLHLNHNNFKELLFYGVRDAA